MQLPQQVSEQGSENDVTLTLSQETNDQSTLSEPSRIITIILRKQLDLFLIDLIS